MTDPVVAMAGWLGQTDFGLWLGSSRWGYAVALGAHVLGLALLVGSIVPLNSRLLGFGRTLTLGRLTRLLALTAIGGLLTAILTGLLLFSVRPQGSFGVWLFQTRMIFVLVGAGSALLLHLAHGFWLDNAPMFCRRFAGGLSLTCWICALYAGRMTGFVE